MLILRTIVLTIGVWVVGIAIAILTGRTQPDAGRMIFWSRGGGAAALYLVDTRHLMRARLTDAPPALVVDLPRPSRDGRRAAFEASSAGRLQVYVRDAGLRTLYATEPEYEDRLPALSPDGRWMAYWSSEVLPVGSRFHNWKLMLFDFERTEVRFLYDQLAVIPYDNPMWSPDGRRFAVRFWHAGRDNGMFIVDITTGEVRSIRTWVDSGGDLAWSPDGNRVAFRSTRDRNSEVYALDLETQTVSNLTQHPANDFQPAWSPDATQIAFVSTRSGRGEIYVMPSAGGNARAITQGGGWLPVWSPSGDQIAYMARDAGGDALYIIGADGDERHRVAWITPENFFIGWYWEAG